MKKIILSILMLAACLPSPAQWELWGIREGWDSMGTITYKGNITKYDIHGLNPVVVHEFEDFSSGIMPTGEPFLASNGKLYGTTLGGGITDSFDYADTGYGVLYEYDLTLNKYRVVHRFTGPAGNPYNGLTEPILGKVFGSLGYWASGGFYTYDIDADSLSMLEYSESRGQNMPMKASNRHIYVATGYVYDCIDPRSSFPYHGSIIEVDTAANTLQTIYTFKCDGTDGINAFLSRGKFIETKSEPGKLWGVVSTGFGFTAMANGLLFEFDISTRTYTPKVVFDGDSLGRYPRMMIDGGEGKLYGVCDSGGKNNFGTLFEYTPATNELRKLHDFGLSEGSPGGWSGTSPDFLMRTTSAGDYLGRTGMGLFRFNPVDNSVVRIISCEPCADPYAGVSPNSFIEICRQPSYREFAEDTVTRCTGSAFSLDLQSDNATEYIWKKDGVTLPLQTTGVLALDSLRAADGGIYTCTMSNECGTTTTMPLHLSVGCSGLEAPAPLDHVVTVYPNPTHGLLHLRIRENSFLEVGTLTVTNLLGQTVLSVEGGTTGIDVSHLAPGLYQLQLATSQGDWNGKFIKE